MPLTGQGSYSPPGNSHPSPPPSPADPSPAHGLSCLSASPSSCPQWWRVIIVNVGRQASKGCGDLIFSSHLTFLLTFAWFYCYMGRYLAFKLYAFAYAAATALCIIASRKQ